MQRPTHPRLVLLLSAAACTGTVHAQDATYWYIEDGGVLAFDMENGPETGAWTTVEDPGALGGGYLRWDGAFGGPQDSEGRRLRYRFVVSEPGNYELRWRSRIDVGNENTEHNDSWVRFPTGVDVPEEEPLPGWTKVFMNDPNGWSWRAATVDHVGRPVRRYFGAGEHEFEIAARSDGHGIDRVVLYRYDALNMNDARLDALPLSLTTTDPAGEYDAGDAGATDGGEPGGDGSDAGDGGGSDAAPLQAVGTCEAGTLVLAPSLEPAVSNPESGGAPALVAGEDGFVWLGFDLTDVPPASSAALRLTSRSASNGARALTSWLGSTADVSAPPDPTAALGSSNEAFDPGAPFALTLDATLLTRSDPIGVGIGLAGPGDPLKIAASAAERPDERPALVLSGDDGFCADHDRLSRATGDDGETTPNGSDADGNGADTNGAEENGANENGGEDDRGPETADGDETVTEPVPAPVDEAGAPVDGAETPGAEVASRVGGGASGAMPLIALALAAVGRRFRIPRRRRG